jgi:LuxR family maltose regulon positive regulatory protein
VTALRPAAAPGAGLLPSKLARPHLRPECVTRPRLTARLAEALGRRLTLVTAPAGSGKTTLLGEWLGLDGLPAAWIALDEGDNDPARFLAYLIAALDHLVPGAAERPLALLRAPEPDLEDVVEALATDIYRVTRDIVLVLDDYQVIDAEAVHEAVAFLVEQFPPQAHLVIATRGEPPLPLARMRARGQLVELGADDLRFTHEEAEALLIQALGRRPSGEDLTLVETRTEGWAAGLQLAALVLGQHSREAIQAFSGNHRFVFDYLAGEVLAQLPEDRRAFLLETCVLGQLSGALCDAVTQRQGGQSMLEELARAGLFLAPLDDQRRWFRYHPLFAGMLRTQLERTQPERPALLHRRACAWCAQSGLTEEAIEHALAAGDSDEAARLVEQIARPLIVRNQAHTLLRWMGALPGEALSVRPMLHNARVWALLQLGDLEAAGQALAALDDGTALDAERATLRAHLAARQGDLSQVIAESRRALAGPPASDRTILGVASLSMGLAHLMRGEVILAGETFAKLAQANLSGNRHLALTAMFYLPQMQAARGQLHATAATCRQALEYAEQDGRAHFAAALAYLGMGLLLCEWKDDSQAQQYLAQALDLSSGASHDVRSLTRLHAWTNLAFMRQGQGDSAGAMDAIAQAEQAARAIDNAFMKVSRTIAACRARLWLAQGEVDAAAGWARSVRLSPAGAHQYMREEEYVTLAQVQIALGKPEQATPIIEALLQRGESAGRYGRVIEFQVLQSLVAQAQGRTDEAVEALGRALALAEPEGFVRLFANYRATLVPLLRAASARGMSPRYASRLLSAMGAAGTERGEAAESLADPLTEREHEVLQLLAAGLANREIAERLYVAPSTVKSQVKAIYAKLGVHSRTQALVRAREAGVV